MIGQDDIDKLKSQGAWIISLTTWKKWLETGKAKEIGKTQQCLGYIPVFHIDGKYVMSDWLLTYGHKQYQRLITVEEKSVLKRRY